MDKIQTLFKQLTKMCCNNIIIAGDFNIDILKRNLQTIELECLLVNYNLILAVNQPTRLKS